jgi:MFS family permease
MKRILPAIVLSQFACTSLWFAGNAIIGDLARQYNMPAAFLGHLSSAVQFGFISGTLLFAILSISDRFSPSKVFCLCALIAAAFNLGLIFQFESPNLLLLLRYMTGFFLAGIYPVGMKIAADHYKEGLSKSLGFLVGALVLGTAFPHLLKSSALQFEWEWVVYGTSTLSISGGLAILLFVPDGPYRKPGQRPSFTAFLQGFRNKQFRGAAFGYFGHMWELYSFWVFLPVLISYYNGRHHVQLNVSFLSFLVIAAGGIACVLCGIMARRAGEKKVATIALGLSGLCCVLSPVVSTTSHEGVLVVFLFIWGMAVVGDSPLFSTLIARNAPVGSTGASLTIVNCIGFAITIVSIQLLNNVMSEANIQYIFTILAAGPLMGVISLLKK